MGMTIKFTVYGKPITKKNHQRICTNRKTGRPFVRQSEQYEQFEKDSVIQIPQHARIGIDVPCLVRTVYFMPDRRRVDLGNLIAASHDILVKAGVLKDDNRFIIEAIEAHAETDKDNPRTEYHVEVLGCAKEL